MRALMHQLLLRVLLLVVFFNTTVGMPLHAAEHLHGHATGPAGATMALAASEHADPDGCASGEDATAHGQCVWCSSYAQLATALAGSDFVTAPGRSAASELNPATPAAFVPQPQRWHFAARDPPSLS